jgi:CP family cyanate transporter-like MFS transporter
LPTNEPAVERRRRLRRPAGGVVLGGAFLLAAFNLRPSIAALSPILPTISRADSLSHAAAGLLTSMPVLCFGVSAFVAPQLVHRRGAGRVLLLCLLALTFGIGVRSAPTLWTLFLGTFVIGVSVGISNVLMPGVVKKDFPGHVALMTGLYALMLNLGPVAGAGLTAPLAHAFGDWRSALAVWAIPVAVAVARWLPFRGHDRPAVILEHPAPLAPTFRVLWHDGTARSISLFWGLQALNFYTVLAWLPTILQRRGVTVVGSGSLLAALNATGVAGSLLVPLISQRLGRRLGQQWELAVIAAAVNAVGTCGLLFDPHGFALPWVMLIGFGQGSSISLAFMMMVLRTADPGHATALSGLAQGIGYLIAACGPVAAGALFNVSHTWDAPLVGLLALLGLQAVSAWSVGRRSSRIGEDAVALGRGRPDVSDGSEGTEGP